MAKTKTSWFCAECGHESTGWLGRCPACGAWNSFTEASRVTGEKSKKTASTSSWLSNSEVEVKALSDVDVEKSTRFSSGMKELDTVLGGGFVSGSMVLLGGEPGIGKSTLILQVLSALDRPVLYVSGEESAEQIRLRAERLNVKKEQVKLLSSTDLSVILPVIAKEKPALVAIDSIQTLFDPDIGSAAGSVTQIREVTAKLLALAKAEKITLVLIGHVTKDGQLAGPRILEHMVDTVLYFEGEANGPFRIVRAFKNRFGATDELGLFEMTGQGLTPVHSSAELFRLGRGTSVHGSAVTSVLEGTRPMLLEIQALMVPATYASPVRTTQGVDRQRLSMLLAVLEKQMHLGLLNQDAYVNVTGGIRITEPAADLAVLAAVLSSTKETPLSKNAVILGEVGLTGEIRRVQQPERRVMEASRLGFKHVVLPAENKMQIQKATANRLDNLFFVNHLSEAVDIFFSL